jgi:uncharacterized sulfatase
VDGSPTKEFMIENQNSENYKRLFDLAFGSRPAEELYDSKSDPYQMSNIADNPAYVKIKEELAHRLRKELLATDDPRAHGKGEIFDEYAIYGT